MTDDGMVTRWIIVGHIKDGDGNWETVVWDRLYDTEDEARENARGMWSPFNREVNDAFAYATTIRVVA